MKLLINFIQINFIWIWTIFSASIGFVLLLFLGQKKSIYYSSRLWSYPILWISRTDLVIDGAENIPANESVIYTANHESSFDIPVMFVALPVPIFYLAKTEVKKIPFFGWYVNAVGMVFIDRKNRGNAMNSILRAGEEIKKGKNIISFPEGTRPRDGEMKLFKRGSYVLALENDVNVVPVAILGSKEVNPPGYKITRGTITVKIGEVVNVSDFDKNEPDVLAKHVENKVREMYFNN